MRSVSVVSRRFPSCPVCVNRVRVVPVVSGPHRMGPHWFGRVRTDPAVYIGSGRVGLIRSCPSGSDRVVSGPLAFGLLRSDLAGSVRVGPGRVRSGPVGSGRVLQDPVWSDRVRQARIRRVWSGPVGSCWVRRCSAGSDRVRSGPVGSGQVLLGSIRPLVSIWVPFGSGPSGRIWSDRVYSGRNRSMTITTTTATATATVIATVITTRVYFRACSEHHYDASLTVILILKSSSSCLI